jgi:predicted RNA-binding Zn ribbon-like protein
MIPKRDTTCQRKFEGDKLLGVIPTRAHRFKLLGGHPALDFVNTVRDWTVDKPYDYLCELSGAIRFGETAGLLTRTDALRLRSRSPHVELRQLKQLRALLRRVFQTWLTGKPPRRSDLQKLSWDFGESARSMRFTIGTHTPGSRLVPIRREVAPEKAGDALLRFRIVNAAVGLLVSHDTLQLKACPACGWFFLDVSKNRSRRWCSMRTCGSVAKARRYYRRKKAAAVLRSNR